MKKLYLITILALMILSIVPMACANLSISDADAWVEGKKKSISTSGGTISSVKPGDHLKIQLRYENLFPRGSIEIQSIYVEGILEGIDDGEDFTDDYDDFDLNAGSRKTITLEYDVPLVVDDDTYVLTINAQGRDENGTDQEIEVVYEVDIVKSSHKLFLNRVELDTDKVGCYRTVNLDLDIVNLGTNDEDESEIVIQNSELGLDYLKSFELYSGSGDDVRQLFDISLDISDTAQAGDYQINVLVNYKDGRYSESERLDLKVETCPVDDDISSNQGTVNTTPAPNNSQQTQTTTTQTPTTTTPATSTVVAASLPASKQSFWDEYKFVMLVGLAYLAVFALVIGIVLNYKKK